jgi:small subunit ribosomal protein S9
MATDTEKFWGTGKRKSSVARVRLFDGEGAITVNSRTLEEYFPRETLRMIINQPFEVTSTIAQYHADVNVFGGGVAAQAVAVRHGITRALLIANPELRPVLKKAGFITRDSREVERKKYGRHKARKRPQYSKR